MIRNQVLRKLSLVLLSLGIVFTAAGLFEASSWASDSRGQHSGAVDQSPKNSNGKAGKEKVKFVEQELLVRFKEGVSQETAGTAHKKINAQVVRTYKNPRNLYFIRIPKNLKIDKAIDHYKKNPDVLYVEPNYIYEALAVPDDPSFPNLWGLQNTGQTGGTMDSDINAPEAWDLVTGSPEVIVAVIDTGVDYNHQDLAANIWTNPGEIPGNGIDDDNNGYIDDVHGINAITGTGNPLDDNNHGTHCSGTIAGTGNNGTGVAGVNWSAKIVACKFLSASGSGTTADAVECVDYLYGLKTRQNNPVDIVLSSNSWGGGGFSQALSDAIEAHGQAGILFIAAAGNSSMNTDAIANYPSGYYLPNIVAVAATDHTDAIASFSNYGRRTVHVGAPGVDILSTTTNNTYSVFSGTSMATPHVSGLGALLKAQDPSRDWKTIKNLILAGGTTTAAMTGKTITGRRIRAHDVNGAGSLSCVGRTVASRLKPVGSSASLSPSDALALVYLNITCGDSNGSVTVAVSDGADISLLDDGTAPDQAAGDGIYSAYFQRAETGTYTLTFPGNESITVTVTPNYDPPVETAYAPRTFSGTKLSLNDDTSVSITLPFPIKFANDPAGFTTLYVSSNGNVSFSTLNPGFSNTALPTTDFGSLIAAFWDDLNPGATSTGGVYWGVTGSAPDRELIIEWRDIPSYSYGGALTFQVVLFENSSDVLVNYADVYAGNSAVDAGASATVGVQISSTLARQYSYNAPALRDMLALLWRMPSVKANAGPDQYALPGAAVLLDGTQSSTSEGAITGYAWVQTAGEPVSLVGADTPTPHFVAPPSKAALAFELTITTSTGKTSSDSVTIVVNVPPVANAGPDQSVVSGFPVSLDGSASHDPDGAIAYSWQQTGGTPVVLTGGNTPTPSFTAPAVPGTLTFALIITDDSGQTVSDTVSVLVKTAPVANAGTDQYATPESAVTLNGSASYDPDGTIVTWSWTQTSGVPVALSGADTAIASFTAPATGQTLSFQLTVTDNDGLSSTSFTTVRTNLAPVANAGPDQSVVSGTSVVLDGTGSYDPDGSLASYLWTQTTGSSVVLNGANTASATFIAPGVSGTYSFRLEVTDNMGQKTADTVSVLILTPPTANAGPDQSVPVGSSISLNGLGSSDPDGTIASYLWEQTAGTPVALTGATTAQPAFTAPMLVGSLTFRLTVTDNMGLTASDTVIIQAIDSYLPAIPVTFEYRTIVGTKLALSLDQTVTITSPFPIRFAYREPGYTSVIASTHGTISFTNNLPGNYNNGTIPSGSYTTLLAPFWDDLYPGAAPLTGGVYWEVIGTEPNRELVVEWREVPHYSCRTNGVTFQVVFSENSPRVLYNYQDVLFGCAAQDSGLQATVGIQTGPSTGRQYSYNAASLTNGLSLLWRASTQLVANAGENRFVLPGAAVTLDGTASQDPNGVITAYSWTQTGGTPVVLNGSDTATPGFTAPGGIETLSFTLTVTDDSGEQDYGTVSIMVNNPPVADAGPDQTVLTGSAAALNGAGSYDPDLSALSFAWTQVSGTTVVLSGASTASPSFTTPASAGTLIFRLTVTDASGQSVEDTVNVTVKAPPVANAGTDQLVLPGSTVSLSGAGSYDPDGAITSYAWVQTAGTPVSLSGVDTANPGFVAPAASGTLVFSLTVMDNDGFTGSDTVNITVNLPPAANAGPDQSVLSNTTVTLNGMGSSDPDGTIASFSWVQTAGSAVALSGSNTATPAFTAPASAGVLTFRLTVTDNSGQTAADTVNVTVKARPVASAGMDQYVVKNTAVTLNGTGSYDPDGTIASYSWAQTAGTPVTLSGANTATPVFTAPASAAILAFELTVTDIEGYTASDVVQIHVVVNYQPAAETVYNYRSITGTKLSLSDDSTTVVDSPFTISFADDVSGFNSVTVSSNGNISFTNTNASLSNTTLPTSQFLTLVAPFWDDLNPAATTIGGVYSAVTGSAPDRELVIEWRAVPHYSSTCAGAATFQVVFFEGKSDVLFNYSDVIFGNSACDSGASATVGVQVTNSSARQFSFNTASLRNDLALLWSTNVPPIANAGSEQVVLPNTLVTLDGTGSSDPEGTIASYAWVQTAGTSVALTGADTPNPTFTTPNVAETLTFQLTVTDNRGASASAIVSVLVNLPPVANAGPDQTVLSNAAVTLNGTGSFDSDGSIVSYAWVQTAGTSVALTGADTPTPTFTSSNTAGTLTFQLTVTDNRGATASATVNVFVNNQPPIANAGPDQIVLSNTPVTLNGTGSSDIDGSIASYAWVQTVGASVVLYGADTPNPVFMSPNAAGTLTFQLTVTDNMGASASAVVNVLVNLPPTANAGSDQVVLPNNAVTLDGTGSSDFDGTIASYAWVQTAGASVTLTGANTPNPTFTTPNAAGALTFQLTVTDNRGATASATVNVLVNLPPTANAGPDQIVLSNTTVTLNGAGSFDPDGSIANYRWIQTAGTSVVLTGANTPNPSLTAPNSAGTLTFQLTVTDNRGATASATVNVLVNMPPTANAGSDQVVLPNTVVALDGTGSFDPDGSIVSYAWVQTAGSAVVLSGAETPNPSFTAPNVTGTLTFQLTVTDNRGAISSAVVNVLVNIPPIANAGSDQIILSNTSVSLNGAGSSDPDGTIISYSWVQTAGAAVTLTGTNTPNPVFTAPNTAGMLAFQLTVTDNRGAIASATVNVLVNLPPTANAGNEQIVLPNTMVTLDGTSSSDPDGSIVSYAWVQTAGVSVSFSGYHTANPFFPAPSVAGTLTFQLTVTDNSGASSSATVNVLVNLPPVANAGSDQTVISNTAVTLNGAGSSDPDGTIANYSWIQTAGTSVVLTGANTANPIFTAPNAAGTFTFKLTVTDNRGATASATVNVLVNVPPTADAGPDQTVRPKDIVALNGSNSVDADGAVTSYQWTQTAGAPVVLDGPSTATPSFTAPNLTDTLAFQLTVTDNRGATSSDSVIVVLSRK